MEDLLLAEELLLLALDDRTGRTAGLEDSVPLPVAVLVDALAAGAVTVEDGRVRPGEEPGHPLLHRVRAAVAEEGGRIRSPRDWVSRLPKVLPHPVVTAVAARLVERGVLREEPGRVLLLFRTTDLPEADPGPERALRARLRRVLVDGEAPSAHDTLLVALLHHDSGRIDAVLAGEDRAVRRAARARAAEITEHAADRPGVRVVGDAADAAAAMLVATM